MPKLKRSLETDQNHKEKGQMFPCEIDAKLGLGTG